MITHTVFFKLKHAKGSDAERMFFSAAQNLANLPGVRNFKRLKQLSTKNNFDFGLSMEFISKADYDGYNNNPAHSAFVKDHWVQEVVDFLEIDYEVIA